MSLLRIVALVPALLAFAGIVYSALALLGARSFAHSLSRQRAMATTEQPGVSVLKPLRGAGDGLRAALESHCLQEYAGGSEILCGVRSATDPASAVVSDLAALYPNAGLRLIVCPEELGTSGKVATLVQLLPHARHAHVLVNDADIVVGPGFLARIMGAFAAESSRNCGPVGMVTAPYIGQAHPDARGRIPLWSRLEALGIATEFMPGVLTARMLEGDLHFGLGSTLAMRGDALAVIGGFAPLLESLADDYELGARISAAGYRVELAGEVVRTAVPPYTAHEFFEHQLRWARSTRDSRRLGYLGLGVTFCVPWAALAVLASGFSLPSVALLSLALLVRVAVALSVGAGLLGDRQVLRDLFLLPLRDVCGLFFWAWSYASNTVVWRGERFTLRHGRLQRVNEPPR